MVAVREARSRDPSEDWRLPFHLGMERANHRPYCLREVRAIEVSFALGRIPLISGFDVGAPQRPCNSAFTRRTPVGTGESDLRDHT
jgi:hypothetical protein